MYIPEAKVVILGAQGVGKTSFIHRYVGQMFEQHTSPTIGASFFTCNLKVDEHELKLLIWDTAGQERFHCMAPMYYRKANAAILMFDITCYESFESMKAWILELKVRLEEPIIMCVVGNKCDMNNYRQVTLREATEYASSIGALYHEASALSSEGDADYLTSKWMTPALEIRFFKKLDSKVQNYFCYINNSLNKSNPKFHPSDANWD